MAPKKSAAASSSGKVLKDLKTKGTPKAKAKQQAGKEDKKENLPVGPLKKLCGRINHGLNHPDPEKREAAEQQKQAYDAADHAEKLEMLSRFEQTKCIKFMSTYHTTKLTASKDAVTTLSGWMTKSGSQFELA